MTTVHLSWFDSIYKWVSDELLPFVFGWFTNIYSQASDWLVGALTSAIEGIMKSAFGDLIKTLLEFLFVQLYTVLATILMILDCIEDCFNIAAGITPVYREVNGKFVDMPLLNAVFAEEAINNTLLVMISIGFSLCFFCAILGTIRSMFEMDGSNSKPVGHVLRQTGRAMLHFVLVPTVAVVALYFSSVIVNVADRAFTGADGKTSVARTIFSIAALDAIDEDKHPEAKPYNSSYEGDKPADFGLLDDYRKPFYLQQEDEIIPGYANPLLVKQYFTFRGIDYVIGFGMGIYFNVILGMVLFVFICRVFEVIVLVIVEPFFIATMPLDDGEHFKKWAELFIGKLFSGFGLVVAMRMYLTISAALFNNTISFVRPGSNGATLQNYLIKLLFLAGGALGIKSIGPLITSLFSWEAAQSEQEQAAIGEKKGSALASFQSKRMGKALMRTGNQVGGVTSAVLAGAGYVGSRTAIGIGNGAQKFGGMIKRSFKSGNGGKLEYDGGAPGRQAFGGQKLELQFGDVEEKRDSIGEMAEGNIIGGSVGSNSIGGSVGSNSIGGSVGSNSIGGSVGGNSIGGSVGSNSTGGSVGRNSIGGSIGRNIIGGSAGRNSIGGSGGNNFTGGSGGRNSIGGPAEGGGRNSSQDDMKDRLLRKQNGEAGKDMKNLLLNQNDKDDDDGGKKF